MDEVSLYGRALTTNEIQAIYNASVSGKCQAPTITSQPTNQTAVRGARRPSRLGPLGCDP